MLSNPLPFFEFIVAGGFLVPMSYIFFVSLKHSVHHTTANKYNINNDLNSVHTLK